MGNYGNFAQLMLLAKALIPLNFGLFGFMSSVKKVERLLLHLQYTLSADLIMYKLNVQV